LGHLRSAQIDQPVLAPEVRERLSAAGFALRDLVLVVRKDQVLAAAVDVERLAQVLAGHGRALYVPARPPRAPRYLPCRLCWLGALPQREVQRVALRLARLDPVALAQLVHAAAGELAVVGLLADLEVDVAAGGVGEALLDQRRDHPVHLGDVLRGAWV